MATVSLSGRSRLIVQGLVQGVGFRPFVYRLATALKLSGGVKNTTQGVEIEIEGNQRDCQQFLRQLKQDLPPHAQIQSVNQQAMPIKGSSQFEIWPSQASELLAGTQISPDLATCADCVQDIFNPQGRHYHYPFTNCTHCGPRYSIITALPYDRRHTSMRSFAMCSACAAEYQQPTERRFHAQPNACADCGPALCFWRPAAARVEKGQEPIQLRSPMQTAIAALRRGEIVAVQGLGGFQLWVDAQNSAAVARLRSRKTRPDKPFALMYPSLESIRQHCDVSAEAARLLTSAQAPIVLLPRRPNHRQHKACDSTPTLAAEVAANTPKLGVMLPTTPLHHLLLREYGVPVVATSGNRSGEPICRDETKVRWQLGAIADAFLSHNRPIQRPVDDSVAQIVQGQPQLLRHARGYAPQRIQLFYPAAKKPCILALGAHLKSAIALSLDNRIDHETAGEIVLSQHIGDLDTPESRQQLAQTVSDFLALYRVQPSAIACDLHPDYGSTRLAQTLSEQWNIPLIPVQHHYAHILSGMADNQLTAPALGIAWDGTGLGTDNSLWGGEFLQITPDGFERVAHFLPYPLPGGDICALEPRRSALGLLYGCYGEAACDMSDLAPFHTFTKPQLKVVKQMLTQRINAPLTSSVGRLFDGIASLLNLHHYVSFEGQAALTVEFAATQSAVKLTYPFTLTHPCLIDWRPMLKAMVEDTREAVMTPVIAAKFHNTLVEMMVVIAQRTAQQTGNRQIVMAGGCFQNSVLTEQAIQRLRTEGFVPYWPQRIPPNDAGIAVGQVLAAWQSLSCTALIP